MGWSSEGESLAALAGAAVTVVAEVTGVATVARVADEVVVVATCGLGAAEEVEALVEVPTWVVVIAEFEISFCEFWLVAWLESAKLVVVPNKRMAGATSNVLAYRSLKIFDFL